VKSKLAFPIALMVVFALTRVPGMLPQNFSAVYALVFCAGVYFAGRMAWWLPLAVMLVTDLGLNLYYWLALDIDVWAPRNIAYLACNYVVYLGLVWLGRRFKPQSSFAALLGGGVVGALLFYLITNTASWFFNPFQNPEYSKTLLGWLTALTKGTAGWPETWQFFRNTLLSGGRRHEDQRSRGKREGEGGCRRTRGSTRGRAGGSEGVVLSVVSGQWSVGANRIFNQASL
jgi:hypothetical protein